jgi:hypothetical protein
VEISNVGIKHSGIPEFLDQSNGLNRVCGSIISPEVGDAGLVHEVPGLSPEVAQPLHKPRYCFVEYWTVDGVRLNCVD